PRHRLWRDGPRCGRRLHRHRRHRLSFLFLLRGARSDRGVEIVATFGRGDQAIGIFRKEVTLLHETIASLAQGSHESGLVAVPLLERRARIAARLTLSPGSGERDERADDAGELSGSIAWGAEVPADMGRRRRVEQ